ncbi:olfactory receptor 1-like [Sinocyclocheilus anshuiensis]|uniref:olfactory receptor 1-like n=1 Tax=Sinocyclocheilus anshuiensis TaxID=1608454 RepID=UPI0007B7D1FB|nr:PREDICTED: olfactory receptor 1-like [Sinocyclocheilus anshuiensis]
METPPRDGGAPMEGVRPGGSGSICVAGNDTLSTLVLPHTSSSTWAGRHGADVAEASAASILAALSSAGLCPVPKTLLMKKKMIQEVTGSRNISFLSAGFSVMPHMRYYYIFLFIAYFISFLGNSCLTFVIITDRNLHTPKYIPVFNLSLTDICESITKIPQQLDAFLFGSQLIPYGLCLCNILSDMLFVSVHSLTLTVLSFDRLVAICLPLRYHMIVTNTSMLVIIVASWMLALMHTIMSRHSFCRTSVIIIHFCDCGSNFPSCVSMHVLFQVIIMFPVFCTIAVTLFRITTPHDRQRATKTCTAHLIVVAVFYVPICLTYVFRVLLSTNTTIIILSLTSVLASVLNLIIYTFMTKDFMTSVKRLIKK